LLVLIVSTLLGATGCSHLGPKTVAVDRFDYSSAIADSWKQQKLLNIVKLRYMDLPVFVDVASIVNGYSIQAGVNVNGTLSSDKAVQGNFASIGGTAVYTDRPTITYDSRGQSHRLTAVRRFQHCRPHGAQATH
jgi:hypothetical protein